MYDMIRFVWPPDHQPCPEGYMSCLLYCSAMHSSFEAWIDELPDTMQVSGVGLAMIVINRVQINTLRKNINKSRDTPCCIHIGKKR